MTSAGWRRQTPRSGGLAAHPQARGSAGYSQEGREACVPPVADTRALALYVVPHTPYLTSACRFSSVGRASDL